MGAVRTGLYMSHILSSGGFRASICNQSFYSGPVSKFWAYAFVLSKAPELCESCPQHFKELKITCMLYLSISIYTWGFQTFWTQGLWDAVA